uniref:hypothetical protein n=1 Tax=Sphingobacterium mizutaii TaxID=1010 RepID=UPI0028A613A8
IFKFENSPGCQSENREGYTLFHQFFLYSMNLSGEQKRGKLEYYKMLYLRTFDGLENLKDSNFSSTDTDFEQLMNLYRDQNKLNS